MEKIDYKAIVDKAIGKKPNLVNPHLEKFGKETMGKVDDKLRNIFDDYPTTKEPLEYKQETYQEFLNDTLSVIDLVVQEQYDDRVIVLPNKPLIVGKHYNKCGQNGINTSENWYCQSYSYNKGYTLLPHRLGYEAPAHLTEIEVCQARY